MNEIELPFLIQLRSHCLSSKRTFRLFFRPVVLSFVILSPRKHGGSPGQRQWYVWPDVPHANLAEEVALGIAMRAGISLRAYRALQIDRPFLRFFPCRRTIIAPAFGLHLSRAMPCVLGRVRKSVVLDCGVMGWMYPSNLANRTAMIGLCGGFHHLALKAYERTSTAKSDREPGQHDALTAIILSVITLESLIGELEEYGRLTTPGFGEASVKRGKLLSDSLELIEEQKGQLSLKLHIAKFILTGVPYVTGVKPFQDFELLVKIRNSLIHPKPFVIKPDESGIPIDPNRKFLEQLRSLNILAELPGTNAVAPLSTWIQTRAAARWACTTAFEVAHSLFEPSDGDKFLQVLKDIAVRPILPIDSPKLKLRPTTRKKPLKHARKLDAKHGSHS